VPLIESRQGLNLDHSKRVNLGPSARLEAIRQRQYDFLPKRIAGVNRGERRLTKPERSGDGSRRPWYGAVV
jgi:hypothetical protein